MSPTELTRLQEWLERLARVSTCLAIAGLALVVVAATSPVSAGNSDDLPSATKLRALPQRQFTLQPLLVRLAERPLVQPAVMQAAVKDNGAAQRLLGSLKLQGVIEMDGQWVAYVQVEKEGVQTIRTGDRVSEFIVEKVESGRVVLSLQGVLVTLKH